MKGKQQVFKKERVHSLHQTSDEENIEVVKSKLSRKYSTHEACRPAETESKRKQCTRGRKKLKGKPSENICGRKVSRVERRRSCINSKNRLTVGICNQGRQSQTIYPEPGVSKLFNKISSSRKAKANVDMSKDVDCSSFQILPLQACIIDEPPDSTASCRQTEQELLMYSFEDEKRLPTSVGELLIEPPLADIACRLTSSLNPVRIFGTDHLQDISDELKGYYRKSMRLQHTGLLDQIKKPSTTPVQIRKEERKRLCQSLVSKVGYLASVKKDSTQEMQEECTPDIFSITEDDKCTILSPLTKPTVKTPSPQKLLPRKLF